MFKKLIIYNVLHLINPHTLPFNKIEDHNPFSSLKNIDDFTLKIKNSTKKFNNNNFYNYLSTYLFQVGFEYGTQNDLILLILYLSFSNNDFDENMYIEKTLILLENIYNNTLSDYIFNNNGDEKNLKIAFEKIDILVNSLSIQECSISILLLNILGTLFNVEHNLYINKSLLNYTKKEFNLINIDGTITDFVKSCKKFILNIKKNSFGSSGYSLSVLDLYFIIRVFDKINVSKN